MDAYELGACTGRIERGASIAQDYLTAEIKAGRFSVAQFETDPAGRPVTEKCARIRLPQPGGDEKEYKVSATGRYENNKILSLQLFDGARWVHHMKVDLTDGKVVPQR